MSHSHPAAPRFDLPGLRHQLLTPLNHIVGYSEMLLEDGRDDRGFDSARQNLARIRETAKDMVRLVQSSLTPRSAKRSGKAITDLRYELAAPLHAILQAVGAVTSENRPDLDVRDVLRIGRAAAELLAFAQGATPLPARAESAARPKAGELGKRRPGRILVVDDNRANRELLTRQLKRSGHEVTEVSSGSQALQMLVEAPRDLVLLDMLMPKLDGFQVLERIKSDPACAAIPVIVISALNEVPGVVRCLEMGAEDYFFKPIDPALLAARIHSSLERKRLHDLEKHRARQLHVSEERLRLALRAERARIWDWNLKTNRVAQPGGHEQTLEETLSRVDPQDRERVRAAALEAVEKCREFHCEFRLAGRGAVRWLESMGILDGGRRMIGVTRDITARKQAEEALQRSNREFEQFALVASHDLREPLRAVSADLETLLEHGTTARKINDVLRSSVESLGRMSQLIAGLLDYSQMSARKPVKRRVSADAVLALVLSDLKLAIEESRAVVTRDKLPAVAADFGLLQRVFQNLISNAVKYCGKQRPRIHVSARLHGDTWLFSVADNGIGVDMRQKDAIFCPFHRAHRGAVPGTGLGLAICRRILEQFGGEIWLEAKNGKGSMFCFTLPRGDGE